MFLVFTSNFDSGVAFWCRMPFQVEGNIDDTDHCLGTGLKSSGVTFYLDKNILLAIIG